MKKISKMKERMLSVVLTLSMVVSLAMGMAPVNAHAEEGSATTTLTYEAVGGSGTMDQATLTVEREFVLPTPGFTAGEGRKFYGWIVTDDTTGGVVTSGFSNVSITAKEDITYTATAYYGYDITLNGLPDGTTTMYGSKMCENPEAIVVPEFTDDQMEGNAFMIINNSITSEPSFTAQNATVVCFQSSSGQYMYLVSNITGPVTVTFDVAGDPTPTPDPTDDHTSHCICGASHANVGNHTTASVQTWTGTATLPTEAGAYYLTEDVTLDTVWTPANGTILCLNGHKILISGSNQRYINVGRDVTFTLTDCRNDVTHKFSEDETGLWTYNESGDKSVVGGVITGITQGEYPYSIRALVTVLGGTFNMYAGNLVGNAGNDYGAGVYVADYSEYGSDYTYAGTINMYGGSIVGNTANYGAGIRAEAISATPNVNVSLTGNALVSHNTASREGGGLYGSWVAVTMSGNTKVENNKAPKGAGVSVPSSTFNVRDAVKVVNNKNAEGNQNNVELAAAGASSLEPRTAGLPVITLVAPLTNGALIGVTLQSDNPFTSGWTTMMGASDPVQYFFSDNEEYDVVKVDGELRLSQSGGDANKPVIDGVTIQDLSSWISILENQIIVDPSDDSVEYIVTNIDEDEITAYNSVKNQTVGSAADGSWMPEGYVECCVTGSSATPFEYDEEGGGSYLIVALDRNRISTNEDGDTFCAVTGVHAMKCEVTPPVISQPTASDPTFKVNYADNATYRWYDDVNDKSVLIVAETAGDGQLAVMAVSEEEKEDFWTYSGSNGIWTNTDDTLFAVSLKKGDVLNLEILEEYEGMLYFDVLKSINIDSPFVLIKEGEFEDTPSNVNFVVPEDGIYLFDLSATSEAYGTIQVKATVERRTSIPGQTNKRFQYNDNPGTYVCLATWGGYAIISNPVTLTVAPPEPTPTPTPTPPSSGGYYPIYPPVSGGTTGGTQITVPVKNPETTVNVTAKVEKNKATVDVIKDEDIAKVTDAKEETTVEIDLTELDKTIDTVVLPTESMEKIAQAAADTENKVDGLTIKLSTATVTLDATALAAVVGQAEGDSIQLNVDDVLTSRLNDAQMKAVEKLDVHKGVEAYFTCNGQRIGDFKGGAVTVQLPFEVPTGYKPEGFSVWYVDDEGNSTRYECTYVDGKLTFVVDHFSDFIVVYDEVEAAKATTKVNKTFRFLRLKGVETTENSINLDWTKVADADGYVVYGNKCNANGVKYEIEKMTIVKDGDITNLLLEDLEEGTYYKFYVKAYKLVNGKKVFLGRSKTIHVTTDGGKYGNAAAVAVNETKVTVSVGETFTIQAEQIAVDKPIAKHTSIKYESDNKAVAKAKADGTVTAKEAGTAVIYVYAQNGVFQKVKVTVE